MLIKKKKKKIVHLIPDNDFFLQFIAYKLSTEIFIILDFKRERKKKKGILCLINFYFSTSINISHAKINKNNNNK